MKRLYIVLALLMIAAALFAGCSNAPSQTQRDSSNGYEYGKGNAVAEEAQMSMAPEAPAAEPDGVVDSGVPGSDTALDPVSVLQPGVNRKIVYRGFIEANTKEFTKDCEMIESRLKEFGGYVENSEISGKPPQDWQDEGRYARMTLRVPSNKFDGFISLLKGVGQNLRSNIRGEDISLQYFDLETKLSTLRNRQSRLEQMLKDPAYKLEAIIELERDLAQVSYDIQMLESERRNYDSLIDFSTIEITLYEVVEFKEITAPEEEDLGTRISNGFYAVLNAVVDFGEGLVIFLVASLPVTIPLGIILVVILVLVNRSRKRRAKALQSAKEGNPNEK